jgi:hypothetical protein
MLLAATACKKEADLPMELKPDDFYVRYRLEDGAGLNKSYFYQGGQAFVFDSIGNIPINLNVASITRYLIRTDSIKQIWSGLEYSVEGVLPIGWAFVLGFDQPQKVTDPLLPPEWTPDELEQLLVAGRKFPLGEGAGKVHLGISAYPDSLTIPTTSVASPDAYLQIESVEDYGEPKANVPYFGKKVRFSFAGDFKVVDHTIRLSEGEGVLLFRYFNY